MAGAYYEKIARINLTTGEIQVQLFDLDLTGGQVNAGNLLVICACHSITSKMFVVVFGTKCTRLYTIIIL